MPPLRMSLAAACLGAAALVAPAQAQEWPAKPVKIVVPFAAGGSSDQLARLLAGELSAAFKQQFYIENRAGSAGALGSAQVARAEPDGYTFVNAGSGPHQDNVTNLQLREGTLHYTFFGDDFGGIRQESG